MAIVEIDVLWSSNIVIKSTNDIGRPNAFVKMYFLYNINKYKINLRIYLAYIYVYVSSVTWC